MPRFLVKTSEFPKRAIGVLPPAEWVVFAVLLLLTATSTIANMLVDCDTGVHIRAGEWILSHGAIPTNDLWSSASPHLPWTLHEWLSQVIFGVVHGWLGLAGVVVLCSLVIAASYAILCRWVLEYGNHSVVSLSLLLVTLAASRIHWLARPHVFTFLFFILWYRQLHLYSERGKAFRLWFLPPSMVLWANLHGGFVTGFVLLGMYLFAEMLKTGKNRPAAEALVASRRSKALGVCLVACLIAACVNPYGPKLLAFPFELQGNQDFLQAVM